jgi:hypothetical protein
LGPDCADSLLPSLSLSFLHVLLSATLSNEILFILSARGNPETSQLVRIIIKKERHAGRPSFKVFRADVVRQLLGHLSEIVYSKQQEEHTCTMEGSKMRRLCVHLSPGEVSALYSLLKNTLECHTNCLSKHNGNAALNSA